MPQPRGSIRRRVIAAGLGTALALSALASVSATAANAAPPAKPGGAPDTLKLAGALANQQLEWEACTFDPTIKAEVLAELEAWENMQCATVTVPQDWHNPGNGKTFDVRISYVKNVEQSSTDYRGTYLVNPGGPGGEGLHWAPNMLRRAPELAANFNGLGIDPRGVGQSEAAQCLTTIDTEAPKPTGKALARLVGEACSVSETASKITSEQTSYDFDFVRGLLGIPKITYIGYSYGTWLGTWYGTLFGQNIDRMILDSSLDGTDTTLEAGWDLQPVARDRQFRDGMVPYTARAFADDTTDYPADDVRAYHPEDAATVEALYWEGYEQIADMGEDMPFFIWSLTGALGAFPDPTLYPVAELTVTLFVDQALITRLNEGTLPIAEGDLAALNASERVQQLDAIVQADSRDARVAAVNAAVDAAAMPGNADAIASMRGVVTEALAAAEAEPNADAYNAFDAIRCGDGQWTQGEAYWDQWITDMSTTARFNAMFINELYPACAFWPTTNPTKPAPNKKTFPQTIVIQGEEDSQTGYEAGLASGTKLPNTTFIAIDNATKHGYFPYRTSCVDDQSFAFLLQGVTPKKKITICQGKPLGEELKTFEMWSPINVNGKHVPGNGKIPSRVNDPETGVIEWGVAEEQAAATVAQAVQAALAAAE